MIKVQLDSFFQTLKLLRLKSLLQFYETRFLSADLIRDSEDTKIFYKYIFLFKTEENANMLQRLYFTVLLPLVIVVEDQNCFHAVLGHEKCLGWLIPLLIGTQEHTAQEHGASYGFFLYFPFSWQRVSSKSIKYLLTCVLSQANNERNSNK